MAVGPLLAFAAVRDENLPLVPARYGNFRILQHMDQSEPCLRERPHLVSVSGRRNSHAHEAHREAWHSQDHLSVPCSCAC